MNPLKLKMNVYLIVGHWKPVALRVTMNTESLRKKQEDSNLLSTGTSFPQGGIADSTNK